MGTSASYRAPDRPRWHAFIAALTSDASVDRVRSELFNAGVEWREAIASPAIAIFAERVGRLHAELPDRLAEADRVDTALGNVIAEARQASMRAGSSPAHAIAERAFARLLVGTLGGVADDAGGAAESWKDGRGSSPMELVAKYFGEVLGQYARHVTDREAGRLVGQGYGAEASAQFTEGLAEQATAVGTTVARDVLYEAVDFSSEWPALVGRAFEVGRALPRDEQ